MTEERRHELNCPEHVVTMTSIGTIRGRLNLLITLMGISIGGIITVIVICLNIFLGLKTDMANIDKTATLNNRSIEYLNYELKDIKGRVTSIERSINQHMIQTGDILKPSEGK